MENTRSLDTLCAALAYAMGIDAPAFAAAPTPELAAYLDHKLPDNKVDRIFMYNPDAIAQWIWEKYPQLTKEVRNRTDLQIPFCSVMPSVTPVCFGTMYTGAQPTVHGIRRYEKPVITIDSLFDAMIRAGKRCAIVSETNCSLAKIFLQRDMDYFDYPTIEQVNAKAAELILEDRHDLIVVYNGNYDTVMHKHGPEGLESLCELRANSEAFGVFSVLIENNWTQHNSLVGFAMDHRCHEIDGDCGSHGLDMDEDLNIVHSYRLYPKTAE